MNAPVYIVAAKRTAVTKANKGGFSKKRPDELLATLIKHVVTISKVNPDDIGDVIIGCAFPEAEQGQNIARVATLLSGLPDNIPGLTINRYCGSGLNAIAIAANEIQTGQIDVAIAGGIESMSLIPMGGNDWSISPEVFRFDENIAIAYGMGLTAENVANDWKISRVEQDEFALNSHKKAMHAITNGYYKDEILPVDIVHNIPNEKTGTIDKLIQTIDTDDGVRADATLEALSKLKSVFSTTGSVTAGNSSQMSDGAAALVLVSESYLKLHNLIPIGRFLGFAVCGVPPRIMGVGPIKAIPKVLNQLDIDIKDIDWIELNEAFASQSLAVISELGLNPEIVNPCGGAIALGHPLGATGAILSTKLLYGLKRVNKKYGMVTMCIGTGMGAAGVFEAL